MISCYSQRYKNTSTTITFQPVIQNKQVRDIAQMAESTNTDALHQGNESTKEMHLREGSACQAWPWTSGGTARPPSGQGRAVQLCKAALRTVALTAISAAPSKTSAAATFACVVFAVSNFRY